MRQIVRQTAIQTGHKMSLRSNPPSPSNHDLLEDQFPSSNGLLFLVVAAVVAAAGGGTQLLAIKL
jgi:hypothetical protein